jgi:hypothetical protein
VCQVPVHRSILARRALSASQNVLGPDSAGNSDQLRFIHEKRQAARWAPSLLPQSNAAERMALGVPYPPSKSIDPASGEVLGFSHNKRGAKT